MPYGIKLPEVVNCEIIEKVSSLIRKEHIDAAEILTLVLCMLYMSMENSYVRIKHFIPVSYTHLDVYKRQDLAEGEYTLTVTTQYSNSYTLKVPRSISTPIWIGGKPADGGGDSESPDEV